MSSISSMPTYQDPTEFNRKFYHQMETDGTKNTMDHINHVQEEEKKQNEEVYPQVQ
jgi:hypothetical protein